MSYTDEFPLSPDYPIQVPTIEGVQRSQSMGRKDFQRIVAPPQRLFRLTLANRPTTERNELIAFHREHESDYFTFTFPNFVSIVVNGIVTGYLDRVFPVRFSAAPQWEFVNNDNFNITVELIEAADCILAAEDYPDPGDGHPTASIAGVVVGSDQYFVYGGYGYVYAGTGTLTLDGYAADDEEIEIPLGLHRVYVTGGAGTLEAII